MHDNEYLACFFVDLKGAYDSVDLDILESKLNLIGISKKVSSNIVQIFRNRKIYIRDHINTLHGPRIVNRGLPQGAVLSPLLFNVYTLDLHILFDENIRIIQYADDICIYIIHKTYNQCVRDLRYVMYCLQAWLNEHSFQLSPNKSGVMVFTRHRLVLGDIIKLGKIDITILDSYKYLGIVIDKKLTWKKHLEHIKNKTEKGINVLKCVTARNWGADPTTSILFYRAYIRSIINYGCIFYGSAADSNLLTVDRIQLKALKICIGAYKSSPSPAVLAEAQEPPLIIRRQFLAQKK